jgi:hypothetical protein
VKYRATIAAANTPQPSNMQKYHGNRLDTHAYATANATVAMSPASVACAARAANTLPCSSA